MCLLVVIPRGLAVAARTEALSILASNWQSNPHGAGLAFASRGQVYVRKPYWRWRPLKRSLRRLLRQHGETSDLVVHLRYATQGLVDPQNTHPHLIAGGRLALAHNGTLPGLGDEIESDTVQLAKGLSRADPRRLCGPASRANLGRRIGPYNKLALLDTRGVAYLVNETSGTWQSGVWYSDPFATSLTSSKPLWFPLADRSLECDPAWQRVAKRYPSLLR